jgi:hypothetical protein
LSGVTTQHESETGQHLAVRRNGPRERVVDRPRTTGRGPPKATASIIATSPTSLRTVI